MKTQVMKMMWKFGYDIILESLTQKYKLLDKERRHAHKAWSNPSNQVMLAYISKGDFLVERFF